MAQTSSSETAHSPPSTPHHDDEKHFAPIRGRSDTNISTTANGGKARRSNSQRSATLSRTRSQNGYGCEDSEEDKTQNADPENAAAEKDPYEVTWDGGDDDPLCPRSFSKAKKWSVVLICSSCSFCVTCASSMWTSTYAQIEVDLHVSRIVATLGLSLFVMGLGLGPMMLGPLSEFYGRRPIYIAAFSGFLIWLIPSAVAQNIQTTLIGRFFDGLAGSAFLSVAGGTVGDMFNRQELQAPMMIYTASPFVGPSIGPLISGFINQYILWRWTFYVLLIWAGLELALIVFFVPETYHPVLLRNKARRIRKETGDDRYMSALEKSDKTIARTIVLSLYRPFLLLTLEPMVLNLCLLSAILLGVLYLFFGAFNLVFTNNHGFTISQVGLAFLGILIGMICGTLTDPIWHKNYVRLLRNHQLTTGEVGGSEPEYRLPPAIFGAVLVPIGLFWFGWTTYASVHWIVPIIGSAVFGMGVLLTYSGIFTFLVDAYPLYAASALAANSFARSSFAAAFPLFGVQMYEKLGYQWATSLLAFLTVAMAPFPYLFFVYGKRIRGTSRFANSR